MSDQHTSPDPDRMTLPGQFARNVARRPEATAVIQGERSWSYRALDRWVSALVARMRAADIGQGSKVLIVLPNSVEFVVTLLAAARVGALAVPINVRYRPQELRAVISSLRPDCTVVTESFLTNPITERIEAALETTGPDGLGRLRLITGGTWTWADPFPSETGAPPGTGSAEPDLPGDLPLICYWTSGTTGDPKGVVHTSALVRNVWRWTADVMGYTSADVLVSTRPFYYISGSCWSLLAALLHGATLVIAQRFDDAELLSLMAENSATVMLGGPSLYYTLLDSPLLPECRDRLAFRTGFFGGMPVKPDFVETVKKNLNIDSLVQVYGMTELLGFASSTARSDSDEVALHTVGTPLPGFEFQLRDTDGSTVTRPGETGALFVRGNVLAGYLRGGVVTSALEADGWFSTGDLLSRREDGNWVFVGRTRDMAKVRGENVLLAEVDAALEALAGIRRGVSIGAEDDDGRDAHIEAVVETDSAARLSEQQVMDWCRSALAPHKVPRKVWFLPAGARWPVTVSGKVRRREVVTSIIDPLKASSSR